MDYKITLHSGWRPKPMTLIHPGIYRVPEDMSHEMAELALKTNRATRLDDKAFSKAGAPENKAPNFIQSGEAKQSPSSAAGQASASKTSTTAGAKPESSPSMTPGASAGGPTSSTPATPSGGAKKDPQDSKG